MIKLGQEVRDKVTGFQGIAMMEMEYLYGCNQFAVSMLADDKGEIMDAEVFDEGRLELVSNGVWDESGIPIWEDRVKLGEEARDKVTRFKGIITSRARSLFGGIKYGLTPKVNENGEVRSGEWFDSQRVELKGKGIAPEEVQGEKKGGVQRDMPKGMR